VKLNKQGKTFNAKCNSKHKIERIFYVKHQFVLQRKHRFSVIGSWKHTFHRLGLTAAGIVSLMGITCQMHKWELF